MTNDQRYKIEDAVAAYGHARAVRATCNGRDLPMAQKAVKVTWTRFMEALDEVEPTLGSRHA